MKPQRILALVLALLFLAGVQALADGPFSVLYKPGTEPGTWVYTITNNSFTPNSIAWFDLFWDDPSWPDSWSVVGSPANWTQGLWDWPSWDCDVIPGVPSPGNSLSGFVLEAPDPALTFEIGYFIDTDLFYQDGTAVVPEPGSLLALGAMAGLSMLRRRRKV